MRILFCAPPNVGLLGECGGVLRLMRLYEASLRARGHVVDYLSPWDSPDWSGYDIGHLFQANGDSFSTGAAVKRRLPLVVSPIIDRLQCNALLRLNVFLDRRIPVVFTHLGRCAALCRMADTVCLLSRREENRLLHGLGVTGPREVVLCPLVDNIVVPAPGRFESYAKKPFALFLGDAGNPRKNVGRLIQAVRGLDVELLIGGMVSEGQTGTRVRALAGNTPNTRLVGVLSGGEKAFLLERASVFVLPSLTEGLGFAAAEAALAGTTVVITKNGGPPDYFGDRAYYVSPYSASDIRNKIKKALAEPLDASARLREMFSLEAAGKSLEACYEACLMRKEGTCAPRKRHGLHCGERPVPV